MTFVARPEPALPSPPPAALSRNCACRVRPPQLQLLQPVGDRPPQQVSPKTGRGLATEQLPPAYLQVALIKVFQGSEGIVQTAYPNRSGG